MQFQGDVSVKLPVMEPGWLLCQLPWLLIWARIIGSLYPTLQCISLICKSQCCPKGWGAICHLQQAMSCQQNKLQIQRCWKLKASASFGKTEPNCVINPGPSPTLASRSSCLHPPPLLSGKRLFSTWKCSPLPVYYYPRPSHRCQWEVTPRNNMYF